MFGDIPKREVDEQLARILKSKLFKSSERLQRFLTFAVESTLGGVTDRLRETVLSRVVFDRDEHFDPQKDALKGNSQRLACGVEIACDLNFPARRQGPVTPDRWCRNFNNGATTDLKGSGPVSRSPSPSATSLNRDDRFCGDNCSL